MSNEAKFVLGLHWMKPWLIAPGRRSRPNRCQASFSKPSAVLSPCVKSRTPVSCHKHRARATWAAEEAGASPHSERTAYPCKQKQVATFSCSQVCMSETPGTLARETNFPDCTSPTPRVCSVSLGGGGGGRNLNTESTRVGRE